MVNAGVFYSCIHRWRLSLFVILGACLFFYGCVYDPEPPLACSTDQAILTPERAKAFAAENFHAWYGLPSSLSEAEKNERFNKAREGFVNSKTKSPAEFTKYSMATEKAKWVWEIWFDNRFILISKCGKIVYTGAA